MSPTIALKARRMVVVPLLSGEYRVAGDRANYTISANGARLRCNCLAGNQAYCSHRLAVVFHHQKLQKARRK